MHPHTSIFLHTAVCVYIYILVLNVYALYHFSIILRQTMGECTSCLKILYISQKNYAMPKGEIRDREKIADNGGLGVGQVDIDDPMKVNRWVV